MKCRSGFFDIDERYAKLSEAGDPLERLIQVVDFEVFRHRLRSALNRSDRGKGGRPPYDPVLQAPYNLSDDRTEFQIRDRLSFMRFSRRPSATFYSVESSLRTPSTSVIPHG
jgi:transposase, IS5 family